MHHIDDLVQLFNGLFCDSDNTVLQAGADEPFYQAARQPGERHIIFCRQDYFASALHEMAHWCIAGAERRLRDDYGYWYEPDGRSVARQAQFARVEARPQALEWIFARACGFPFCISLDNLQGDAGDSGPFRQAVLEQAKQWQCRGLGSRALRLQQALAAHYSQPADYRRYQLDQQELR
ncbi:MAG TPA: elongation factor P hydroxylase [Pseudomonadales bacterium]